MSGLRVDEARKLVTCTSILDADRWVGTWHGELFECRALPDTSSMVAGTDYVCHVLPGTTELVTLFLGAPLPRIIIIWSGSAGAIPTGWHFCDGTWHTNDLRDHFVCGAVAGDPLYGIGVHIGNNTDTDTHTHTPGTIQAGTVGSEHAHSWEGMPTGNFIHNEAFLNPAGAGTVQQRHNHPVAVECVPSGAHIHDIMGPHTFHDPFDDATLTRDLPPPYLAKAYICNTNILGQASGVRTIPIGGVIVWSGVVVNIPTGWHLCDGNDGTIDLRDEFAACCGPADFPDGSSDGSATVDMTHTHTLTGFSLNPEGGHTHTGWIADSGSDGVDNSANTSLPANFFAPGVHRHASATVTGSSDATVSHTHNYGMTVGNAGGAASALPRYYTLAFIQRLS